MSKEKVFVGMSGGVDSSVSAALLVEQGYDVTGVYMKNWSRDLPGMKCPWAEDLADAKRVAVKLGIDFKVFDFETDYKHKVVDYMVAEYKAGRTPNPDIMCNQEVKFKLFYELAREQGADLIATGHYARAGFAEPHLKPTLQRQPVVTGDGLELKPSGVVTPDAVPSNEAQQSQPLLMRSVDEDKDQTYFLYRISEEALSRTLFPVGELKKPAVRALAHKFGLTTASKKESMGVCFVGSVGIREFLSEYVEPQLGDIVDEATGKVVGQHDGAVFYTVGQRHGLSVGGGLPYYVTDKNMAKNIVFVTTNLNDRHLWQRELVLRNVFTRPPFARVTLAKTVQTAQVQVQVQVRTRHRAPLVDADVDADIFCKGNPCKTLQGLPLQRAQEPKELKVVFKDEQRAVAPGQSVVFYDGEVCVGGGIA
ncbi:MAG: tRNA-specific 2-thiouridylase [Candidatus Nomurabacteria bacterium]|jgi:tRNA-specific 2-thiouridylase|nr:tRNA-specific 2-thiouridylase [Candidatus Nomurabacteria bacterium]